MALTETIKVRLTPTQKTALYKFAAAVGAIGQRGPSVQQLMIDLAELYIADPKAAVKFYETARYVSAGGDE